MVIPCGMGRFTVNLYLSAGFLLDEPRSVAEPGDAGEVLLVFVRETTARRVALAGLVGAF